MGSDPFNPEIGIATDTLTRDQYLELGIDTAVLDEILRTERGRETLNDLLRHATGSRLCGEEWTEGRTVDLLYVSTPDTKSALQSLLDNPDDPLVCQVAFERAILAIRMGESWSLDEVNVRTT